MFLCRTRRLILIAALAVCCRAGRPVQADPAVFEVTLSPTIREEPFSGRVYVFTTRGSEEPRKGPDWLHPEPFLARDVVNWLPGEPLRLAAGDADVVTFPREFSDVSLAGARVQAVARFNPLVREVGTGVGNGISGTATVQNGLATTLRVDRLVAEPRFDPSPWSKLLEVRSRLLSDFLGRDVVLRACVTLPASYYRFPQRRYPTLLVIPGFGGTHLTDRRTQPVPENNERGVEFLRVVLDPSCPLGHHVFADSANNGPVEQALIEELIPAFDRQFRSIADGRARFLNGHSSGGWSSLWLQITAPDSFGGVWSTAPDSVDFRDFQRIDVYQPGVNVYVDEQGHRRPIAVDGDRVLVWFDDFAWMEQVLGDGGQLHSFEAVFSPRGDDGRPQLLFDRQTGAVDPAVARSWEAYDIRLILQRHWNTLAPKLTGKIHIFMGSADTFLLDGATRLLAETLQRLGSDAVVEIQAGRNHRTLVTDALRLRIRREMTATFLSHFPDWPTVVDAPHP